MTMPFKNLVKGIFRAYVHWEIDLEQLVAFVPVHLRPEINSSGIPMEDYFLGQFRFSEFYGN